MLVSQSADVLVHVQYIHSSVPEFIDPVSAKTGPIN
jgi:hypothetical protein